MTGRLLSLLAGLGGALAGASVVWVYMAAQQAGAVSGARRAEREAGVVACNDRVGQIEAAHNAAVFSAIQDALAAAGAVRAPETEAEIKAACKASRSCRSREAL
jgi:hypothetical protein